MTWRPSPPSDRVCEWFAVLLSQDIDDGATESAKSNGWLDVIQACNAKRACDGHEGSYWSRVIEEREKIWIWSFWTTKKAYQQYKETDIYQTFRKKLACLTTTTPTENVLDLSPAGGYSKRCLLTGGWPSITLAYFNAPIVEDQVFQIRSVHGLKHRWNLGLSYGSDPAKFGETRGFLKPDTDADATALANGGKTEIFVIIDWWSNPDWETAVRRDKYQGDSESVSLESLLNTQLTDAGCEKYIVQHARFRQISNARDYEESLVGRNLDFTVEREDCNSAASALLADQSGL